MDQSAQEPNALLPKERIRVLADLASVKLDNRVPIHRYFRSGTEMLRMADVYYKEGQLENAYVLYLKFLTIFIEKVVEHPDYKSTIPSERNQFNSIIKEILPKTETLKQKILEKFQKEFEEYVVYRQLQDQMKQTQREKEIAEKKMQMEEEERQKRLNQEKQRLLEEARGKVENIKIQENQDLPARTVAGAPISGESGALSRHLPDFDRNLKPRTGASNGLRKVIIPANLLSDFVVLAHPNTENNVETCGILAGRLANNEFWITHLLIPKQKGTSDSCTTQNEEDLFSVQDRYSLITLGWIHTHPTQTAFLSSVDLHTHCSYQLMMPEAIAIVCAPKFNETGYFTLTPNHGLETIASCRENGFHPHPSNPPLFQVANHVEVHSQAPSNVIDLRKM